MNQTLPRILKEKREKLGISIKDIADKMGIKEKYIYCMEEGKWDVFPSRFHLKSYLKAYMDYLKIDKSLIETYKEEIFGKEEEKKEEPKPLDRKRIFTAIFLFLIFLIIILSSFIILP